MIEGTLGIRWVNSNRPSDTRTYWANFIAYRGVQHGALPHEEIVGEELLLDYLIGLQSATMTFERRMRRAQEWLLEIHSAGHIALHNTMITEERYNAFRPAS